MDEKLELNRKTKEELKQLAQGLEIPKISSMKKDELIEEIIKKREENIQKTENTPKKRTRPSDAIEVSGILEVLSDGFGFLRVENYRSGEGDIYVSPTQIRRFNLKTGDEIMGDARPSQDEDKFSALLFVKKINGDSLDVALKRKNFEKLTPIYPTSRFHLSGKNRLAAKMVDLIAPVGKGQRGLIVAPPKAGKTTLLKEIAQSITENHPDVTLIVLLIDERPEEVTDMRRSICGEVVASTFDQTPESHTKCAEMVLERAMRLVEQKKDVVILMDSITRLARAYNLTVTPTGRTLSGGLDPDALIKPKKFFGAARNIEEGGSLTILATALVETGSRMDEVIFEEFKGTGNMELKLDRGLQERRIFPAIDILKSGTRREEVLLSGEEMQSSWQVRRCTNQQNSYENTAKLLNILKSDVNGDALLTQIIKTFKK